MPFPISTAIGTGLSLAGSIFGAIKGGQANRATQRLINSQREENKAMYNNNANKDFLQTNVAKDATRQLNEGLENNQKAIASRGAITGATDEAKVAGNTASLKTFTDGLSNLASRGTQYQNQQEAIYRQQNSLLNQQQIAVNDRKADSASNLGKNSAEALGSFATDLLEK